MFYQYEEARRIAKIARRAGLFAKPVLELRAGAMTATGTGNLRNLYSVLVATEAATPGTRPPAVIVTLGPDDAASIPLWCVASDAHRELCQRIGKAFAGAAYPLTIGG